METAHAGPPSEPDPRVGAGAFPCDVDAHQATARRSQLRPFKRSSAAYARCSTTHAVVGAAHVCLTSRGFHCETHQQSDSPSGALLQLAGSSVPVLSLTLLELVCGPVFASYLPGPKREIPLLLRTVRTHCICNTPATTGAVSRLALHAARCAKITTCCAMTATQSVRALANNPAGQQSAWR